MKRTPLLALAGLVSTQAFAVGQLADVTVVDRDSGETLKTHYYRGEYWVAGRPGAHYAIQIRNQQSRRLLAVTAVDGVNVISGETAAFGQQGYVFDPWVGYDIAGWRKSDSQIAAFTFTSIPRSYAARTGRPGNVGVIGVALFRDMPPPPPVAVSPQVYNQSAPLARAESEAAPEENAATGAAADSSSAARESRRERAAPAPSLGTGHGRREHSSIQHVAFEREQSQPNEIIRIRYDSHENLVAMGVIHRPPPARQPNAFPDEPRLGYVPDP